MNSALADYPEELPIYRGEAEGSTDYRQAFSWSLDINTAFFFACRHGDQNHARIIRARIYKKDAIALNLDSREKEILAIPGIPFDVTVERLIGPDSPLVMPPRYLDEYRKGIEQIRRLYKLHRKAGTDHGQLHSARVLFLALAIIQAGKIKLNLTERTQLLTAIVFHDMGEGMTVRMTAMEKPAGKSMKITQVAPQILPSAFSSNIIVLLTIWQRNT